MSDRDKDNPFGSTPPDNPFGSTPSDNPFGSSPPSDPFGGSAPPPSAPPPPADPGQDAWRAAPAPGDPFAAPPDAARPRADGAIPALILGIIGIAFCPLCAPFAWVLGRQAEQKVDASGGMLSGRGEATAGKVLGIVSCALSVLAILLFIALVVVGSSISAP